MRETDRQTERVKKKKKTVKFFLTEECQVTNAEKNDQI